MDGLIRVVQLPIIEEHLRSLKQEIEQRTQIAASLVCTDETLSEVKSVRADLNKEFAELEEQRKAIKQAIMQPYEQFESIYKECVSDAFKKADCVLKIKITDVENGLKSRCKEELKSYFDELCTLENLDFLKFEQLNLTIDMASARAKTPKKLREQIETFIKGISADLSTISNMENSPEILMEYKQNLNLAQSIGIVNERKTRIEREKQLSEQHKQSQEAQEQAVAKVEAIAPPIEKTVQKPEPQPELQEKIYSCKFTVYATKEQLLKLKNFLNMEGIEYE